MENTRVKMYPHLSMAQAEAYLDGEELRRHEFVWSWAATRMGGCAGARQERYYERHGRDHFWRRINQVRRICGFEELQISGVNK